MEMSLQTVMNLNRIVILDSLIQTDEGVWSRPVMGKLFKEGAKGKEKNFRRANIIY